MTGPRSPGVTAFVCAMPMELTPLARRLALTKTEWSGVACHAGTLDDRPVVAIVTGMGTTSAARETVRLLDAVPVDRVVVVGITGAAVASMPVGALVVPEVVIDGATGAEHRPSPLGRVVPHGTMWTADVLVVDPEVVAGLGERGVVAFDMETSAIAAVCEQRGIPWSVFRAVSDRATDGSVDDEVLNLSKPDGTPNWPAIARYVMSNPTRLAGMARLGRGARMATRAAAGAAVDACSERLDGPPSPPASPPASPAG